jgi:hypothetical protein
MTDRPANDRGGRLKLAHPQVLDNISSTTVRDETVQNSVIAFLMFRNSQYTVVTSEVKH